MCLFIMYKKWVDSVWIGKNVKEILCVRLVVAKDIAMVELKRKKKRIIKKQRKIKERGRNMSNSVIITFIICVTVAVICISGNRKK